MDIYNEQICHEFLCYNLAFSLKKEFKYCKNK